MGEPDITEAIFSNGQNEGVERSILPLPQLAVILNARQRKSGRWGKRYGVATLSATTIAGATLGNGTNARRCIGPGFCTVDDKAYVYDRNAASWTDPVRLSALNSSAVAYTSNPRVPGVVSGWLPDTAYLPVPSLSQFQQFKAPCAQAYCLGYLWHAVQFVDPQNLSDTMLRVTATNPTDNSLVFMQDFRAATAGNGGLVFPKLVACGGTLVLSYASQLTAAGRSISGRALTSLLGGFGAEAAIETVGLSSTGRYDASSFSGTHFVVASFTVANSVVLRLVNATGFGTASSIAYGDANPIITGVSIVGASGLPIYLTVSSHNNAGPADATRVAVYTTSLGALIGTATVDATISTQAYSVMLPAGGVRCIYGFKNVGAANVQCFSWVDVSAAPVIATAQRLTQYRYQPISKPFVVGTQVYLWCTNVDVLGGLGYATLLRVPALSEYPGTGPSSATYPEVDCPIELSAQDFLVTVQADTIGIPAPAQIGTSADWAVLLPTFTSPPTVLSNAHEFRVIQAKHYSDAPANRSVSAIQADGCSFLPGGVLVRIDERGAVEEGFAQTPILYGAAPAGGGGQTASCTYEYVAVFKSRSSNNRFEVSGVSPVLTVAMGAGQTLVTLSYKPLESGARSGVQIEIYRTLANGSVFYLVAPADGSPDPGNSGARQFIDGASDAAISSQPVLYTQVGQTLSNCFPPPSRFGVCGAQRVHLGGLLRPDVSHCSKLILGDQSPSWADNDAFRIVWPSTLTGLAFMDNLMGFTDEGVYVVTGDGPDDSGDGVFSPPQRLPYADGCIEPRSIYACDEGTFYQTRRGLYMIPRGFGAPIPAGDVIMDTLAAFPIITGVVVVNKSAEQTIRWACVDAAMPTAGRLLVYDLAHKCWSVDTLTDGVVGRAPYIAQGQWFNGEVAMAGPTVGTTSQISTVSTFDDSGSPIGLTMATGDLRPFGSMSEGVMSRVDLLAEVRSACTLLVGKKTEFGQSPNATRVFALAAGDTQVGQVGVTEIELGNAELREAMALQISWAESSTSEGLAFVALAVEHQESEGLKRVSPLSRAT